jgi:hypothetical protein
MTELAIFFAIVLVVLAAGIGIGMLVAPRLTAWATREDEESGDDRSG